MITSKSMPDILKVGYTKNTPEERAKTLNHTGNPHPYEVIFALLVKNPKRMEAKAHIALRCEHSHEGKEWFRCTVDEAVETLKNVITLHSSSD